MAVRHLLRRSLQHRHRDRTVRVRRATDGVPGPVDGPGLLQ